VVVPSKDSDDESKEVGPNGDGDNKKRRGRPDGTSSDGSTSADDGDESNYT